MQETFNELVHKRGFSVAYKGQKSIFPIICGRKQICHSFVNTCTYLLLLLLYVCCYFFLAGGRIISFEPS